jgi:hypothetical protein
VSADVPFFTQRDAASTYPRLARRCEALFRASGRLAPDASHPAATVVLATLSRRAGVHADAWAQLVPESVLLADIRADAAGEAADGDVGAATAETLTPAIRSLQADLRALLQRLSPVADEPARRLARAVLADLDEAVLALGDGPGS